MGGMRRILLPTLLSLSTGLAAAGDLTDTEMRWLKAGWPVVAYAKAQQMPVDIVVQPQSRPGDAPLAMGFVDGRCKLVLAMRGNPEAEATLDRIAPPLLGPVVEAMVAHELGHCWRYVHGDWHTLPVGFVDLGDDNTSGDPELNKLSRDMRETRREEGFADLVGLAWTWAHHPAEYRQVHTWLEKVRDDQPLPGAHHDTRTWLRLAREPWAFPAATTPFEQARALWSQGLMSE
jgi:hypothetical protein